MSREGEGMGRGTAGLKRRAGSPGVPMFMVLVGMTVLHSVIIPFLLIFSLKCLFLNDVYDPLNHTHQGPVLDAPTGRFASRSPQQQPRRLEASAHRQLL